MGSEMPNRLDNGVERDLGMKFLIGGRIAGGSVGGGCHRRLLPISAGVTGRRQSEAPHGEDIVARIGFLNVVVCNRNAPQSRRCMAGRVGTRSARDESHPAIFHHRNHTVESACAIDRCGPLNFQLPGFR